MYLAHYWRHFHEYKEPFYTPRAAIEFLEIGADQGTLSAEGVICPDGEEVTEYTDRWEELKLQNWPDEQGVLF